jgi:hypothetical protein
LDAEQRWSSQPDTAAPGDAVTRTIALNADDVSAMAFPPMQHPEIGGVAIYPGQPSVNDTTDRGALRGRREESVTYVFETPGEVALPDIVLTWWDIGNNRLRQIELPGLQLVVEGELPPEPNVEAEVVPEEPPRDRAGLVVSTVAVIIVGLWLGLRLGRWYQNWRSSWLESEKAAFRHVNSAFKSRDPRAISAAIMRWLDRLDTGVRPARLDLFLDIHGDESTREAAAELARGLATGDRCDESQILARGLKRARRHYRQSLRAQKIAASVLPELNGGPPLV